MSSAASDIRADFLVEVGEILDQLGAQMVALERAPADRDCLNAVFRGFHTIKGGAGFLDFVTMVSVCHAVEDRLNAARDGSAPLDADAFDGVQQGIDLLVDMLHTISAGLAPEPAPQALLDALRAGAGAAPAPAPVPVAVIAEVAPAGGDPLDDLDFEALLDSLHGAGGAPGEAPPAATPAPAPEPAPAPAPRAAAPTRPAPAPEPADLTVRVDVRRLDAMVNLVGELVLARNRLKTLRPRLRDDDLDRAVASLDVATSRLQGAVMTARMQPVGRVFSRFPKLARDVARQLDKQVQLEVAGADTELDRNLVEALADPLVHLVRNAIDHGLELPGERRAAGKDDTGTLSLSAAHQGASIVIEIEDDGRGLDRDRILRKAAERGIAMPEHPTDAQVWDLVFAPGFSTADQLTDLSGRGVGMDVVRKNIAALGGHVEIRSRAGQGTTVAIRLPLTMAIVDGMSVAVGDEVFIVPLSMVIESLLPAPADIRTIAGEARVLRVRDDYLPLLDLASQYGLPAATRAGGEQAPPRIAVVVEADGRRLALEVDELLGQQQVVVKNLESNYRRIAGVSGATILGDGRVALIVDAGGLAQSAPLPTAA